MVGRPGHNQHGENHRRYWRPHRRLCGSLAATLWPGCRLIACECNPDNVALLKRNLLQADKETGRGGDKETLANARIVEAAIVGEEVSEVEFHAVADKAGRNSGGGSCFLREPGSQAMRVPALSIRKLWREEHIDR